MKWILIVGGGCILMWCLTKLSYLHNLTSWVISASHRRRRRRLKELLIIKDYQQHELNKTVDEVRRLKQRC